MVRKFISELCNYRTFYVNVFFLLFLGEYAHGLVGEGDGEGGPMHPPNFDVYPHFTGAYGKAVGPHTIKKAWLLAVMKHIFLIYSR